MKQFRTWGAWATPKNLRASTSSANDPARGVPGSEARRGGRGVGLGAVSTTTWTGGGANGECRIDGECWPAGSGKPGDPCSRCSPAISTTTWTPAADADAIACDDGQPCTKNDTCAGGSCVGTPYTCSDAKSCTDDVCSGDAGCRYPVKSGQCLIDGQCHVDGERADATTCRVCDGAKPGAWSPPHSPLAGDDGNPCTPDDLCDLSACGGVPYVCDDARACTLDSCDGSGQCSHTVIGGYCLIAGDCWVDGAIDPSNRCHICDSASPSAWSAVRQCKAFTAAPEGPRVSAPVADHWPVPRRVDGMCAMVARDCSDRDPCTIDGCDPHGGCYHRKAFEGAAANSYQICPEPLSQAAAADACSLLGKTLASFDAEAEADEFDALVEGYGLDHPWVATFSGVSCGSSVARVPPQMCRVWETATYPACSQPTLCDGPHPFVCQLDCDDSDPCTADGVALDSGECSYKPQACDCTPECGPGQCGTGRRQKRFPGHAAGRPFRSPLRARPLRSSAHRHGGSRLRPARDGGRTPCGRRGCGRH